MGREDEVSVEALQDAIRGLHGCESRFVKKVPVHETFNGETVWQGDVSVFDLVDHPAAKQAYAWSYATEGTKRRFIAVLALGGIMGPAEAVRASILVDEKAKRQ